MRAFWGAKGSWRDVIRAACEAYAAVDLGSLRDELSRERIDALDARTELQGANDAITALRFELEELENALALERESSVSALREANETIEDLKRKLKLAAPRSDYAERQIAEIRKASVMVNASPADAPNTIEPRRPSDVLTGEQAKAYLLAVPGSRVRREDIWIEYSHDFVKGPIWSDFKGAEHLKYRYIVLPPNAPPLPAPTPLWTA